jgi:hypothetical protein
MTFATNEPLQDAPCDAELMDGLKGKENPSTALLSWIFLIRPDSFLVGECVNHSIAEVEDLFSNEATKQFSVYSYRAGKLETCQEYRVFESWDLEMLKLACARRSVYQCVVEDRKDCSEVGAQTICQRKDSNTHEAIKMVNSTNSFNRSGFSLDECR